MHLPPCLQAHATHENESQSNHRRQDDGAHAGGIASAACALLLDSGECDVIALAGIAAERLGIGPEGDVGALFSECQLCPPHYADEGRTYIVQTRAGIPHGDYLDARLGSVRDVQVGRQLQLGDAECPVPCGIPELGGEGVVEVGDVGAEAEVDEDVGPSVMQVEDDAAAGEGPVCSVAAWNVTRDTSACGGTRWSASASLVEGGGRVLTRIFPLGVVVARPEGCVTPFWILEPEMGRGELGDGEEEEGGAGHVLVRE